jgi:hypothetical protein
VEKGDDDGTGWALREAKKAWWRNAVTSVLGFVLLAVVLASEVVDCAAPRYSMRFFGVIGMLVTLVVATRWFLRPSEES